MMPKGEAKPLTSLLLKGKGEKLAKKLAETKTRRALKISERFPTPIFDSG